MYLVWKHRNLRLFLHFFIIWISCTPGALCYHIMIFIPKTGCQTARPCLIIQQFSQIFVISFLHTFVQVTLCVWSYDRIKTKPPFFHPKPKKHSWPFLTSVGDMTTCSSSEKDRIKRKRQKLASKEHKDKRKRETENRLTGYNNKSAGIMDFFSKVSRSAVCEWLEQRSSLIQSKNGETSVQISIWTTLMSYVKFKKKKNRKYEDV